MAERPEDLNLPNAVVARIIKDAIPEGVNVSKEARLAISKAASVFVLYATSCSNNFAVKNKRKTINAQDVLSAMEDMEFEQFIEPLQQCQEAYRAEKQEKKKEKSHKPPVSLAATLDEEGEVEEVSEEEDVDSPRSKKKESAEHSHSNSAGKEDFIITVNNEVESDSSPEVLDAGE